MDVNQQVYLNSMIADMAPMPPRSGLSVETNLKGITMRECEPNIIKSR